MKRTAPNALSLNRETLASLTDGDLAVQKAGYWPVQPIPPTRQDPICDQPSYRTLCV